MRGIQRVETVAKHCSSNGFQCNTRHPVWHVNSLHSISREFDRQNVAQLKAFCKYAPYRVTPLRTFSEMSYKVGRICRNCGTPKIERVAFRWRRCWSPFVATSPGPKITLLVLQAMVLASVKYSAKIIYSRKTEVSSNASCSLTRILWRALESDTYNCSSWINKSYGTSALKACLFIRWSLPRKIRKLSPSHHIFLRDSDGIPTLSHWRVGLNFL